MVMRGTVARDGNKTSFTVEIFTGFVLLRSSVF